MVCPHCGTNVPDGTVRCPACRAEIDSTLSMGRLEATFCPSCGAYVGERQEVCPHCGMPLERPTDPAPDAPPVLERPAIQTELVPQIESAIPSQPETTGPLRDETPEPPLSRFVVAMLASLVVVGGAVLAITHPWNPLALDERARVEADTSKVGFPGELQTLTGQDGEPAQGYDMRSADERSQEQLETSYAQLGKLHDELAKSEDELVRLAGSADAEGCRQGAERCDELAFSLSNLISDLEGLETTASPYAERRDRLLELGNWLRNWSDVLVLCWDACAEDPAAPPETALAALEETKEDGTNAFRALFEQAFATADPTQGAQVAPDGE